MVEKLFLLKKSVSLFFLPLSIVSILMISGLIFLWITKKKNIGKIFISLGVLLFLLASYGFLADRLAASLENRYPPLVDIKNIQNPQDIKYIVVLGGGSLLDSSHPLSSQLGPESLFRLLEGVRLHSMIPGAKLILSGGAMYQDEPLAETMAKTSMLMGVSENKIIKEDKSLDTADEARLISDIVGKSQFILVTSAIHMPRAIILFKKFGMSPIASPTNYMVAKRAYLLPEDFFPNSDSIKKIEAAIHEYMGLIWVHMQ